MAPPRSSNLPSARARTSFRSVPTDSSHGGRSAPRTSPSPIRILPMPADHLALQQFLADPQLRTDFRAKKGPISAAVPLGGPAQRFLVVPSSPRTGRPVASKLAAEFLALHSRPRKSECRGPPLPNLRA